LTQDQKDSFSGPTVEETIKQYFPNEDGKKIHEMYDALYEKYASQMVLAIPGVEDTIQHLHDDGYLIGVVSNKTTNLIEIDLNLIGIDSCIDCVIGAENMPKPKPSSSGLVAACDALNVGHDDLVYVGDTCQDIQAARNMAAYSIAFSAYSSEKKELLVYDPCRLIHSFSELQDIVQESRAWCDTRIW
jgi:phosphatidylglycerol:prolipoprotein diacylglycerol transferase